MNASLNTLLPKLRNVSSGFTLIELMVTIAVLAIIVGIAVPNISTQLANQRVKSTAATLTSALKEAKVESRILRQPLSLTYDSSTKTINVQNIVSTQVVATIASYRYDSRTTINSTVNTSQFRPNKTADAITYTICDIKEMADPRQIEVSSVGNIVNKMGGTCT
ncbi:pilus assembly FimT family protein [Psychrobacter sp. AOP7-B1-25]|uniref:pilus assembly FimT family protein n=1 Tax=Psychrobacter sp. AOP7-B1-25 TaxID=3457644 RepID=UPI00402B6355